MALRDVLVRIVGKEDVSTASKKAEGGLKSLGSQAKALLQNELVKGIGLTGMIAGLYKAVQASNELEASSRRLDATAKITGVSLSTLREISDKGTKGFGLSAMLANDFAAELAKLAGKAGEVGKASPSLEAFLDIGAARGLGAADTLSAVRQAILGIDEGTDKLFNKNPSVIYKEFADKIGTTAGKLTDQQKAQALLNAAMEDGGKVRGEYQEWLKTAAGQQAQLTIRLQETTAELGKSLTPAVLAILPVLDAIVRTLGAGIRAIQAWAVRATVDVMQMQASITGAFGSLAETVGNWIENSRLLGIVFGDSITKMGAELSQWGGRQVDAAEKKQKELLGVEADGLWEIYGAHSTFQRQIVTLTKDSGAAVTKIAADELVKRKETEEKAAKEAADAREKWNKETIKQLEMLGQYLGKERDKQVAQAKDAAELLADQLQVNLGAATAQALTLTTDAMEKLLVTLKGKIPVEQYQALNAAVQQHKRDLSDTLPPAEDLADAAKRAADENKRISEEQGKQEKSTEKNARQAADLARAFIDAASATGLIDAKMASILNSAISLAANIGKAFGGDPTAIAASVTSLANIIANVGTSETERRRQAASAANTQALERLTREVGNLNLRESGKTFAGIQNAVDASIQARADARAAGKGPGEADNAAKAAFLKSLQSQGIGLEEARALFKELFGRDLALANAGTFFQDIQAFAEGLKQTEFGQFGSDFASQLDAVIKGFDIFGTEDADDKLKEFRDLVGRFSPALAQALAGDLSTPEGRAQASKNLQALFQKLKTGGLSPEEIGVSGNEFLSLISTILPLLAEANGTLASGASTAGAAASVAAAYPLGAPGLPSTTVGLGIPTITGAIVPAPTAVTTITGGLNITNLFPNATNADEISEQIVQLVDEALLRRYDNLRAASGALASVNS